MYASSLTIYGSAATPVYARLADQFQLPCAAMLLAATRDNVDFGLMSNTTQVYWLNNLREVSAHTVFQLRFIGAVGSTNLITLFLSVESDGDIHQLHLAFPDKGDRHCTKWVLAWLKALAQQSYEVEFQIKGWAERDDLCFLSERRLAAFRYNENLERYLHIKDNQNGRSR